ncbi:MAG: lactate utilization protein [Chloroflexi bacterium]|nr:lactate utilization protein [Chloroflexota bacterium]
MLLAEERDITPEKSWHYEQLAKKCQAALKKNNFGAFFAPTRAEALAQVMSMIPENAMVGIGDSVSVLQIGVIEALDGGKYNVLNPFRAPDGRYFASGRSSIDMMRQIVNADVFITGTNAVTLDGKLVNTDGFGNRVSAIAFGPKKVILVVGANKITANVDEALRRIREVAAPMNARRHTRHGMGDLPCGITGSCSDCRAPRRICCATLILDYQRKPMTDREPRINVVLVGEELGL